ncbi:Cytochrome P450 94A1 [Ananas comosus]|uniref:Cytochrome P450 94A1 n=1 Tax=Ananas comosus TaxID=4615 RepID=A0A199W9Q3_ANACO|nr:Cytochrome P450 94A1 [Ananas comosus]
MELIFFYPLFLLLLLSFSLSLLFSKSRFKSKLNPSTYYPPSLKPYPLVGHLPQFLANRRRMADWLAETLAAAPTNTVTFHRPGGVRGVITANPANVEHILRARFDNYPKGARSSALLHDFLGRGIFNSDGDAWRAQRKTASFEFNTRSLRSFVVRCVRREVAERLIPLLDDAADRGRVVDLQDVLERFAFDNVCQVSFGHDPAYLDVANPDSATCSFAEAFRDAADLSAGRFRYAVPRLWRIKKLLGVGSERRLGESVAAVHAFALEIIRSREKEGRLAGADDLLSRFVANEERYSEEFLRDIVISFLLAGRETTSSALSWFFWVLSSWPDVERRILDELRSVGGGGGELLGFEELREMQYLHAALTEAMRLYPPVPVNSTEAKEDDVLPDGTAVRKGWFVSYNAYAMGRMEAVWGEDCREYRPERWLDGEGAFRAESPYKYPVFHAGPRMCLGKEMAYIQMKSVAACVVGRYVFDVVDGRCPEKVLSLTLRMKDGLPVRVRRRCNDGSS